MITAKKTIPIDGEQRQLAVHGGHHGQGRAEAQRARVAHEDLRRVDVEPEEPHQRADDERAEDGQVGLRQLHALDRDQADQQVGDEAEDQDAAGQAVEPIGQVHRVAGADDDEGDEADEQDRRDLELAEERDVDAGQVEVALDVEGGEDGHDRLPDQLPAPAHADPGAHVHEVVDRAEDADADERQHRRQRGCVLDAQRHGQEQDHADDEHAAHRRRAGLAVVRLRPLDADLLPDSRAAGAG